MYRYLKEGESKIWHILKGVGCMLAASFVGAWAIFHVLAQFASYLPLFPVVNEQIIVSKNTYSGGRGLYFIEAKDSIGQLMLIRTTHIYGGLPEEQAYSIKCRNVLVRCQILDIQPTSKKSNKHAN